MKCISTSCPFHHFVEVFLLLLVLCLVGKDVRWSIKVSHVYFKEQQSINLERVGHSLVCNNRPIC